MQSQEQLILSNSVIARKLFKTQFSPLIENYDELRRLIELKIKGQAPQVYQKFVQKEKNKKQADKDRQPKNGKEDDSIFVGLLNKLIESKSEVAVQAFKTYQKNIVKQDRAPQQQMIRNDQNQLVLSKTHKGMQINIGDYTRMGLVRANNIRRLIKPKWHAPFKLYRVIVGHQGWVRSIAVSPCNTFFATGSVDRTIKFWDMASGELKISLTGHISAVRGVEFSKNYPYLFSCGQDKSVKCWDLEMNKVIRSYHGHLSGVYCLKVHDALGVLVSGGRDSTARVWDIRVRRQVHSLVGHAHTVGSVITQQFQPHVVTGSFDSFIKLWDIGQGKCMKTLTNHKKSVRTMVQNPFQYTFASASADNIKVWKNPEGEFLRNISGHKSIIDAMAVNEDGVLVSGGDDGTMKFWDWTSGYNYQELISQPQPGSIGAENGIFALNFDRSGSRLLSGECDKTIKMWKQDQTASEETHPIKQFKMEF